MKTYEDGLRAAYTSVLLWMQDLDTCAKDTFIENAEERWRVLEKGVCLAIDTVHNRLDVKNNG